MMEPIVEAVKKSQSVLVCSHIHPDGDALASMLAMGQGLERLGKRVVYYNRDGAPVLLRFLPGAEKVITDLTADLNVDIAMSFDCGALSRLGDDFAKFKGYRQLINIDHHASNDSYGDLNLILPEAASTGEVTWLVLQALGCPLTEEIATNIYCTLVTDTGSFRYSNTTGHTLRLAAEMVEAGANPAVISQNLFETRPLALFELLSRLLERLSVTFDGRIGWSVIYRKDLEETQTTYEMTEDFITYPRSIDGVEVAAFFKEADEKKYKVSLRSKTTVDVSKICESFGGGGHKRAAACTIGGDFEEVKEKLFSKIKKVISHAA